MRRWIKVTVPIVSILAMAIALCFPTTRPRESTRQRSIITQLSSIPLQRGDIIFRRGRSLLSRAVMAADPESSYSHVGLVYIFKGSTSVIHSLPASESTQHDGVIIEPITEFLSPENATSASVYRLRGRDRSLPAKAASAAYRYATQSIPFDNDFNLYDQSALYCTELVWASYMQVGVDLTGGHLDRLDMPLRENDFYVLPSTLTKSSDLEEVRLATTENN